MRRLPVSALAIVLALLAGAPAFAAEKTLTVGAAVFPDSLRSGTSSYASLSLLEQTNDPLLARDNKGDLHPALATSWEPIDPTTMRFHLRQGVKFSDGVEFTADDVVFTINRVLDPKNAYAMLPASARCRAPARSTNTPSTSRPRRCSRPCCAACPTSSSSPSTIYEKAGADAFASHPIGTGPFVFQEWVPGDHYTLTANKSYWGGAPKFDKLVIRTIPDGSTRVASLVAGESQIIEEVPIDLIDQVNSSGNAKVDEISTSVGLVLTFDPTIKPFDNPKVREAFDYAIDKPLILQADPEGPGRDSCKARC